MADEDGEVAGDALPVWARSLIGIIGAAAASFGTLAVFIKDTNVAGVPLLIVAGAGFLYVALTGQRLMQVNKDGVIFDKARRLQRTLDAVTTDPSLSAEAKEHILNVAEANGVYFANSTAADFEHTIHEALISISREFKLRLSAHREDYGYDFLLANQDRQQAAVWVKAGLRTRGFSQIVKQLRSFAAPIKVLVVDGELPSEFKDPFRAEGIWVVDWDKSGKQKIVESLRSSGLIQST